MVENEQETRVDPCLQRPQSLVGGEDTDSDGAYRRQKFGVDAIREVTRKGFGNRAEGRNSG